VTTHLSANVDMTMDRELRERATLVIPGGMYGHMTVRDLAPSSPQYFERAEGCHLWDYDGREYIDYMCSWGPIILGHHHPKVDSAAARQAARGDCMNGPAAVMVELSELFVSSVPHADWAMFCKNGTDATTWCLMIARAQTRRGIVLAARGAYHGSAPWCNPWPRGLLPEERSHMRYYTYNDLDSVLEAAQAAGDDLAGVIVTPFKHESGFDQEDVDPAFARGIRKLCNERGAALILDDVRGGLRLGRQGSWEPIGVRPDLSAWGKAIGNGYAVSAVLGSDSFRRGAERVFETGSFWYGAVAMAASYATLTTIDEEGSIATITRMGTLLKDGLEAQAREHGVPIRYTGPVGLPNLGFPADQDHERARVFADEAAIRGVYVHPQHNWFLSAAHTDEDLERTFEATDHAFARVRREFGET
jgi:glutamate-1-semialdehyde 2,1-aminomutase